MSGLHISKGFKDWQALHGKEEKPKTIPEQMEEIVEEMCQNYCKWPTLWDEEAEGHELSESDICSGCPLSKLT